MYQGEPEIEFFRKVPTVWDETKVVRGEIGRLAAIARRAGDEWFVGVINGGEARSLRLPLSFLGAGRKCVAHIYADDDSAATRTKVSVSTREADAATELDVPLKVGGGMAMWIAPTADR
jgi:alpha-glucosidase